MTDAPRSRGTKRRSLEAGLERLSALLDARARTTLRGAVRDSASLRVLPFAVGPYVLAIEATRIVEVQAGALETSGQGGDPRRPTTAVPIHALLRVSANSATETILARADGSVGRAPGPCVAFPVDGTRPLLSIPLEALRPLPDLIRVRLEAPIFVGVLAEEEGDPLLLVDPALLLREWNAKGGA